jgi:cold shock CspA family protein
MRNQSIPLRKSFRLLLAPAIAMACVLAPAASCAQSRDSAQLSSGLSEASGYVAVGALSMALAGSVLVVGAVHTTGEIVTVVLREAGGSADIVIHTSAAAARDAGLASGQTVSVVAESGGYALLAAGRLLAFIPNELGKEMLYHAARSR